MVKSSHSTFEITRVVPPRQLKFFFSEINGVPLYTKYKKIQEHLELKIKFYEGILTELTIDVLETIIPDGEVCNIKNLLFTKPRTVANTLLPPADKLERIK